MIGKICTRLELPQPEKVIHIEDVASAEDIETAMRIRFKEGKHVIPVPPIEITRAAPQIVFGSIRVSIGKKLNGKKQTSEKTIVRPEFSKPEKENLSDAVLTQMVKHVISEYDTIIKVKKVRGTKNNDDTYTVSVMLQLPIRHYISTTISDLQEYIADCLEKYGNIRIKKVTIDIEEWG